MLHQMNAISVGERDGVQMMDDIVTAYAYCGIITHRLRVIDGMTKWLIWKRFEIENLRVYGVSPTSRCTPSHGQGLPRPSMYKISMLAWQVTFNRLVMVRIIIISSGSKVFWAFATSCRKGASQGDEGPYELEEAYHRV